MHVERLKLRRRDHFGDAGPVGDNDYPVADIANIVMLTAAATMGAPPDPALANLSAWLRRTVARPAVAREIASLQAYVASLQAPTSATS